MIDHIIGRRLDKDSYHCGHTARDVWEALTGVDLTEIMPGLLLPPEERTAGMGMTHQWKRLKRPQRRCIALFRRYYVHVGVYIDGRVAHMTPMGVQCLPLHCVELQHGEPRFYIPDPRNDESDFRRPRLRT